MPIVEFTTPDGLRLLVNSRREAISILVNDDLALNFDWEGRLTGAWIEKRNYRRSLDNRVIEKAEGPRPGLSYRVRRELDRDESKRFLGRVYDTLSGYRAAINDPRVQITNGASANDVETVIAALDRVLKCNLERLEEDRRLFQQIYKPISILPPDQYLALVLQATEGCSYNRCAFCGFYRDRSFAIKDPKQFKEHIALVRSFFGKAINLRKSIFLADANALMIPQERLLPLFEMINAEFAIDPPGMDGLELKAWRTNHPIHFSGIYSFIDAFTGRHKSVKDYIALGALGLRRVYVGLESGDAALLEMLGKPNTPDDVVSLVERVKKAGVAVGLVILAGAGGHQYADQHVRHTADLINSMPLDENDLIYFSELVDYAGSDYSALAFRENLQPLTIDEIEEQMAQMRAAFHFPPGKRPPQVSYYDIREFIY